MSIDKKYHVCILGGGLAGLTLAIQLKQKQPEIGIVVLERRSSKAKDAAHKVGESTVELGTYYLRETLGLADYLDKQHLRKLGLRFYFSNSKEEEISERTEFGVHVEPKVLSHQLDRGILENDLMEKAIKLGIDLVLGAKVLDVKLGNEKHKVSFQVDGDVEEEEYDWIVDASGRANILKHQEGLALENAHDVNAIWFRVKGEVDVNNWSQNKDWNTYLGHDVRRLGTIHFMGKGYWIWVIPLVSGNTSIGIVSDAKIHPLDTMDSKEKTLDWLKANEPVVFKNMLPYFEDILDFKRLKNYSYNCKQFYSTNNWGIVGEAGAFLDPFYSPGTDFIALGNTWMTDLISRAFEGENTFARAITYDKVKAQLLNNWLPIYLDKYALFGKTQLMLCKISWDFAYYWSIPSVLFTNNALTNMDALKAIFIQDNNLGDRFRLLNANVQQFYEDWGSTEGDTLPKRYFDPLSMHFLKTFQEEMVVISPDLPALLHRLESNLKVLENVACSLFRIVSEEKRGVAIQGPVNPYRFQFNGEDKSLESLPHIAHEKHTVLHKEVLKLWQSQSSVSG